MSDKEKKLIAEMKKAVPKEKGDAFDVKNAELTDKDLEAASGGELAAAGDTCACLCGGGGGCSGGGGG
jgi:hypothetical protein